MKKIVWCILLLLLLLPLGGAYAEQTDGAPGYNVEAEVDSYGLDALDGYTATRRTILRTAQAFPIRCAHSPRGKRCSTQKVFCG